MSPRARRLLRWTLLTVAALSLGTALGTVYALNFKAPVMDEAPSPYDDVTPPSAPLLLTPKHESVVPSQTPELTWTESVDDRPGFIYVVELGYDRHFSTVVREYANIREPRFQIPADEPLAPGLEVYWRVYALDVGLNQGPYSPVFAFTPLATTPVLPPEAQ